MRIRPHFSLNEKQKVEEHDIPSEMQKFIIQQKVKSFSFRFIQLFFPICTFSSDAISEESLRRALFVGLNDESDWRSNSKFGDVINLSNGKLDVVDGRRFRIVELQPNCRKQCMDATADDGNVTAFWIVHKIRHRDEERRFRYELKITVKRALAHRSDGKRELNHDMVVNSRSFLLRDSDYPELFAEESAKYEQQSMDKRIFNTVYDNSEVPFRLNYRAKILSGYAPYDSNNNLNIGEYFAHTATSLQPKPSNIVQQQEYVQAIKPPSTEKLPTFHPQPYFWNKNDYPDFKAQNFRKIYSYSINNGNSVGYTDGDQQTVPNPLTFSAAQRLQISDTTSQAPIQFPDANGNGGVATPTSPYRRPYDGGHAPIVDSELDHTQPQLFAYSHSANNDGPKVGGHIMPTTIPYETNTSPSNALFRNHIYTAGLQSSIGYQADDKPYWYGYGSLQQPSIQGNFIPSHRYQENPYSELDPIYHNPTILVTPVNLLPVHLQHLNAPTTDTIPRTIAQLPIEAVDINSPTENYRSPAINAESGFTTPLSYSTSSNSEPPQQLGNEANAYPDSINAQLPPPESDTEVNVPYVEADRKPTEVLLDRSRDDARERYVPSGQFELIRTIESAPREKLAEKPPSARKQVRISTTQVPTTTSPPETTTQLTETTTARRTRNRGSAKFEITTKKPNKNAIDFLATRRRRFKFNKPTTTTREPFTITTTTDDSNDLTERDEITTTIVPDIDFEPRTSQSIQKSVSVRVGDKITVMPKQSVSSSISSNIKRKRITARKLNKPLAPENTTGTSLGV